MSASGMPISQQAAALRIIGATTSLPRSSACTGPTVTASSPVPSHAFEMTPVRTQRFNWMSCSRARSRPAYRSSFRSAGSAATIRARSGSPSTAARNARTSCGSGFQSTYSGGSKAEKRFTGPARHSSRAPGGGRSRKLPLELAEQAAPPPPSPWPAPATSGRLPGSGERLGEFQRRAEPVVGVGLQRPDEGLLAGGRGIRAQLPDRDRLAPQARDHHLLRVAALERELPGEHLEGHDAERV